MERSTAKTRALVGARVREERHAQGISLRVLSNMTGGDYKRLCQLENGRANVTLDTLAKVAEGLDVPLVRFFEFDGGSTFEYSQVDGRR